MSRRLCCYLKNFCGYIVEEKKNKEERHNLPIIISLEITPALLIITSTPPNFSSAHLKTLKISSSCRTSHCIGYTSIFNSCLILSANSSNFSSLLATAITFISFFASALTICAPIPALAPVTIATFPIQRSIVMKIFRVTVDELNCSSPL